MTAPPELTVVVVTYASSSVVGDCLRSLLAHPPSCSFEIVVVDNASPDDTRAVIAAAAPQARIIANPDNRGLAAANNQGIVAGRGQWIVLSNPDVIYGPGAVDALLDCARRHERAAFVIANLHHSDGTLQTSAGDLPRLSEALLGRPAGRRLHAARADTGFWWYGWAHDEERAVGHGAEACYLVRRAAVAEIGPQDEGYRLDWEGIDWARRAAAAGWEIWFCPTAQVVHIGGVSIKTAPYRWIRSTHRGMYRYYAHRTPTAARPLLATVIGARAVAKMAVHAVRGDTYGPSHHPEST